MAHLIVNILGSRAQGQRESATREGRHGARLIWIVRRTGKGSLLCARYQRQQGIKNYCGQKCSVLFAQYCCRELIVGGVFCRSEFFVECFRAECFLEARQFLWRNSLMSMNRGLETGNDHREDRFGVLCSKTNHHPKYEFSMRIFVYRILVYIYFFLK